ncbi:hypothetical protein ACP70R_003482 [Stipagrostis hirtigluma subsp. patula]
MSSSPSPSPPASAAMAARDWAALSRDILSSVFLKLGPREVMLGSEFACTAWRRAALDEPKLWRRVGLDIHDKLWRYVVMDRPKDQRWLWRHVAKGMEEAMKRTAMDRAAGQCEAYGGSSNKEEDLLDLVERAPCLKCLHLDLYICNEEQSTIELLSAVLTKLPLLEDLQIYIKNVIGYDDDDENLLQSICQASPSLRRLVLMYASSCDVERNDGEYSKEPINGGIPMMHELRTLELYDCELSNKGLMDILDSCPLLKSLHITGYFNKCEMDKELRMKCARVKNLTLSTKKKPRNSEDYNGYY